MYAYDGTNRLSYQANGTYSNFYYDGLGRLSQVVDSSTATQGVVTAQGVIASHSYVWFGDKMGAEFDDTHLTQVAPGLVEVPADAFYFAQGTVNNPSSSAPGASQLAYDVTDLLGSERAVVTNDAIAALYTYDTFGNRSLVSGNAAASNRGFTGFYYHAPSGLQFARNRAYNASLGRWLTRDPIGNGFAFNNRERFNATDLNLYAYAGNNPQSVVDPSGNDGILVNLGVSAGGGFGAGAAAGTGVYIQFGGHRPDAGRDLPRTGDGDARLALPSGGSGRRLRFRLHRALHHRAQ